MPDVDPKKLLQDWGLHDEGDPAFGAFSAVPDPYVLVGGDGSPYSCKLRAVLRYRRIPFLWRTSSYYGTPQVPFAEHFPNLKARVIPILIRPDGTYGVDSTPLLLELEAAHSLRRVVPCAPGDAFLAAVLEDFADEWMTKVMFEGRFHTEADARFGAAWQAWQTNPARQGADPAAVDGFAEAFAKRQVGRRALVGSSDWGVMERTLRSVCEILRDAARRGEPFLFGLRPTNADFALYGQLRELAADPLPARIMHEYPEAWGWVWMMDDLSGAEPPQDEGVQGRSPPAAALALLKLAGDTYLPFLKANAEAFGAGGREVRVPIFGGEAEHVQPPFKYQATYCWPALQRQFAALGGDDLQYVRLALADAGCAQVFANASKM